MPTKHAPLIDLADHCNNGACNAYSLIRSLGKAIESLGPGEVRTNPAVKVILGQITYLVGESIGPSTEAAEAYDAWRKTETSLPVRSPMWAMLAEVA